GLLGQFMILQIVSRIKRKKKMDKIKETCLYAFLIFAMGGKFLEVKWMVIVGSIIFWIYFLSVIYLIWTNRKEVGQLKPALKKYSGDLYVLALPILLLLVELVMVVLK
ncbi:MAG: hypothetical protein II199_05810, partial [Bacteroidaceae bacterium]|nr:hypothetical protein [Bacteroidaceae bacterium]